MGGRRGAFAVSSRLASQPRVNDALSISPRCDENDMSGGTVFHSLAKLSRSQVSPTGRKPGTYRCPPALCCAISLSSPPANNPSTLPAQENLTCSGRSVSLSAPWAVQHAPVIVALRRQIATPADAGDRVDAIILVPSTREPPARHMISTHVENGLDGHGQFALLARLGVTRVLRGQGPAMVSGSWRGEMDGKLTAHS